MVDNADILSAAMEAELTASLATLEQSTRDQLVVVTTPDLKGEPIEQFALRLGNCWGIGQADLDNGALLVVAPTERKVRIEVGLGLQGLLTNERAGSIIQDGLLPVLREGDYDRAAQNGVAQISALLLSERKRPARGTS